MHDKITTRIGLAILLGLGLLALCATIARGSFGSFIRDQPFLASGEIVINPCDDPLWPYDSMADYTNGVALTNLNGGCNWNGPYVAITFTNIQAEIYYRDAMAEYSDADPLQALEKGTNWIFTITHETYSSYATNWSGAYVVRTYEDMLTVRYHDGMAEYTNTMSLITDAPAGGTNWFASQITNALTQVQAWTNGPYVGKGF